MASIGPSTIASSFERLLILPGGGGDSTNLIPLTDGDAGTTFGLKLSTTDISVPATGKVYLDGGSNTYISETSHGIIEFFAEGNSGLKLNKDGAVQYGTLTVGVNDTGYDVKFFGATASNYMLWDESQDQLVLQGSTEMMKISTTGHADYGPQLLVQGNTSGASPGISTLIEIETNTNLRGKGISFTNADDTREWFCGVPYNTASTDLWQIGYHDSASALPWYQANAVLTCTSAMRVGIGTSAPDYFVDMAGTDLAGDYVARFKHDGGTTDNKGIRLRVGEDAGSSENRLIRFDDGDGSKVGEVNFTGGTTAYGTFTAQHKGKIPDSDNESGYSYGTLLEFTSLYYSTKSDGSSTERGIRYNMQKSSSAYSKTVLGAYTSKSVADEDDVDSDGVKLTPATFNEHGVNILGDGHIICNNEKGNIAIGDGITSSSTAGVGMKADKICMIIGIAQEDITFSGGETKLVAVQYGIRQFTPWAD